MLLRWDNSVRARPYTMPYYGTGTPIGTGTARVVLPPARLRADELSRS